MITVLLHCVPLGAPRRRDQETASAPGRAKCWLTSACSYPDRARLARSGPRLDLAGWMRDRPHVGGDRPNILIRHIGPAPHGHRLAGPGLVGRNAALDLLDKPLVGAGAVQPESAGEGRPIVSALGVIAMAGGAVRRAMK